jgi:hypothetical protein
MAVSDVTSLSISKYQLGIQVTKVTDSSSDWASVSNSTYFYDKTDNLVHYKDGSGNVLEIFSSSGGLTYFTETGVTTSPNATVPVAALIATSASTNMDVAIVPKGNGAIIAAIPNSGTAGGNKRGQYSVDLQLTRAASSRIASGNYSVAMGRENTASGTDSISIGSDGNATNSSAIVIGTGTASGVNSAVLGFGTASNLQSFSIGYQSTASGQESMAIGHYNVSNTSYAYSFGRENTTSGFLSLSMGSRNTASGQYSVALGRYSDTFSIYGRYSYAGNFIQTSGDSQKSLFILKRRTTNATSTTLTADNDAAGFNNQVILSNQSGYRFKGSIIGKQSGTTNVAAWDIDGLIVRGSNAASVTLETGNVTLVSNTPGWGTPTIAASTFYGGLLVQVIGSASTNIQWTCSIDTTEVIYA